MNNEKMDTLKEKVKFSFWKPYDEKRTVVRFVTSWATTKEELENLRGIL